MSFDNNIPHKQFEELLEQVPIVELNFKRLLSLQAMDFPAIEEETDALIAGVDALQTLLLRLRQQSIMFRDIFGHDAGTALMYLAPTLKEIHEQASELFDNKSLDTIIEEEIAVKEGEMACMDRGFVDALREMTKHYCMNTVDIADTDADDDSDIPLELREKAAEISIEPYSLRLFREEVLKTGINEFDALFLEYFGGSCEGVDIQSLRQRIRLYCVDQSETQIEIAEEDQEILRLMQFERRDVEYWRSEVREHANAILQLRSQVGIFLWTVCRTIESIGYWVPEHTIKPVLLSIQKFLEEALPALRDRFTKIAGKSSVLDFVPSDDSVVSIHQGTVGTLLLNIVANAGKHGKASELRISTAVQDQNIPLMIEDNGIGFSDEIANRMYKMGFSGGGSSGIGLANADERMSASGGSIEADGHGGLPNRLGVNGAKFTLTIPIVK